MTGAAPWEADTCRDEQAAVSGLLQSVSGIDAGTRESIGNDARDLVVRARGAKRGGAAIDALLQEFGLSNTEGVALMCLAESLLRVPDGQTADRLIAEKIRSGDWAGHLARSNPLFVNAAAWGMLLTGRIVHVDREIAAAPASWLRRLVRRVGEPAVRAALRKAMRTIGHRYVLGRSVAEASRRGLAEYPAGTRFSFDMLGEGARAQADADRYFERYERAVAAVADVGKANADSVSIKLSALHPRYVERQRRRVVRDLLPRLLRLAVLARDGGIALTVDAEEADRLPLSLELYERLARHPELAGWNGLGIVLQAYQKRAAAVAAWLATVARETGRQVPVRLVKGAYWDTEIKDAQRLGLADYPVYTRKANTDLAWLQAARELLAAGSAIYPQFATHNAYSMAAILRLAPDAGAWELQRLHGMGDVLYDVLADHCRDTGRSVPPIRVYAPVGTHDELLPYLVRRLLENGANSSFVHRYLDPSVPVDGLVRDVVARVAAQGEHRHPCVPRPRDIYTQGEVPRPNAAGIDLADRQALATLTGEMAGFVDARYGAAATIGEGSAGAGDVAIVSPANPDDVVGTCRSAGRGEIERAMAAAAAAQVAWDESGGEHRAAILDALGRTLVARRAELISLVSREAGRTLDDAQAEVREAVDFCHYYAELTRRHFAAPRFLTGPTGERNRLSLHGRGVFASISPWNFPLAIFVGQATAALGAGNAVAAKPAEQTPLVAARAVSLMRAAGVPGDLLQLLPGDGATVGEAILGNEQLGGVAFTGSTATARHIQRVLAARDGPLVPLIAETGGLNAMIADTTCLPEQLVDDVIASAFLSAGQRCSALRVLFLPRETADSVLEMLCGACDELALGDPSDPATDIGPVIDARALAGLHRHLERMRSTANLRYAWPARRLPGRGHFFGPHILEIANMGMLDREVFGPILHVVRYAAGRLDPVLEQINACGYGLTLGVHSRIDGQAESIFRRTRVGNTYVNRDMVGAVVGVNPFGGQGLSGTGPKAGGPHYLLRFAIERTMTVNLTATGGNVELLASAGDANGSGAERHPVAPGNTAGDEDGTCLRGYN